MKVSGASRVLGIFGDPVSHSLSPAIQNAALEEAGIDAVYVPFHVRPPQLESAVSALRALDIDGVNVTIPHKEAVCRFLDEIEPEAQQIGAVNTIVNRSGHLIGCNTDGRGFLSALEEELEFTPKGKNIIFLGAGGASRAGVVALCRAGAGRIWIANRTRRRARDLVEEFSASFPETRLADIAWDFRPDSEFAAFCPEVDLIVNSTAVGLEVDPPPDLPWPKIPQTACFYDMVYSRDDTPFVEQAARHGHRCADGLGMLVGQGEIAFELWTGTPPPYGVMKSRILAEYLGK